MKTAYEEGADLARRALEDPTLPSMEAIVYAQNRQGEFARGFDDTLGGCAKEMLSKMRAAGAA